MRAVQSDQRVRGTRRAVLGGVLALALGLVPLVDIVTAPPASAVVGDVKSSANAGAAVVATSGAGLYKDRIVWVNWGQDRATLNAPADSCSPSDRENCLRTTAVTTTHELSARDRLEVVCTMFRGNGQTVEVYRPGTWNADGMPHLYGTGTGTSNTLITGFRAPLDTYRDVTVQCSAELATYGANGYTGTRAAQAVQLAGLVVADPESTKENESITFTGATPTTWRIIDRYAGSCGMKYYAEVQQSTIKFTTDGECASGQRSATVVAFGEGATQLSIQMDGRGGQTGAAVGYVLGADYGDAQATYGHGPALVQPTWTGGTVPAGRVNVLPNGFSLATVGAPTTRLGAQALTNKTPPAVANADGDTPDEDAFPSNPKLSARVGTASTYTLTVACTGTGAQVRGWLDWNGNNVFTDATEASAVAPCTAGSATLTWTGVNVISQQVGRRVLRVAIGTAAGQLATPTSAIPAGEVEDWILDLLGVRITKTANVTALPADGGTVNFTITVFNDGAQSVTAYLADDYSAAIDDATLSEQQITRPTGVGTNWSYTAATNRFAWSGSVPANGQIQITYPMTVRSGTQVSRDLVLTNVVAVSTSAITGPITCVPGSVAQTERQCARVDIFRAGLTIDKQAFLKSDTTFASELAPGVQLAPGTEVVWRYVVRNTGAALSGVVVSDAWAETRTTYDGTASSNGATTITCPGGYAPGTSVTLGALAAGATVTCTATKAVVPYP